MNFLRFLDAIPKLRDEHAQIRPAKRSNAIFGGAQGLQQHCSFLKRSESPTATLLLGADVIKIKVAFQLDLLLK